MLLIQKPRFGGDFFYVDADALYAFKGRGFGGEIGVSVQARGRYPLPKLISPNRKAPTSEALYHNGTRFHFEL